MRPPTELPLKLLVLLLNRTQFKSSHCVDSVMLMVPHILFLSELLYFLSSESTCVCYVVTDRSKVSKHTSLKI